MKKTIVFARQAARVLLFVLCIAPVAVRAAEPLKSVEMVSMRDGTKLSTAVYRPAGAEQPLPVILNRTPYGKFTAEMAKKYCDRGYVLVSQDLRGRFDSEGSDAVAFHNDGWSTRRDGHVTIDWIVKQKWCNGKVATAGGSALGITQNMLAPDAPEALKAQQVIVAASNLYSQVAYQGGAWRKELAETWLEQTRFDPQSLETYLAHPRYDDFWAEMNPEAQAPRVKAPAIFIGGWYDIFSQGTLNSFATIHNNGAPPAKGNCRLIMGPTAHGGFNALKYPENSRQLPEAADALRFFDFWLKGLDNGVPNDKPVHYYVMGDPEDQSAPGNYWRAADNWPPPSTQAPFYLHADNTLSPTPPTSADGKLTYQYDPKDPVRTIGGQNLFISKGPIDQSRVEKRDDVLLFTTDVLAEPVEVTGRISARLYVSSDCPDTDFTVKLCDVYSDDRSMLVTDGILRARYREGFERETFLEPGIVYEISVDLWSTSLIFNKGHRIRVAVSSSNSPRFEPNPNTGKPFRADDETRVAANALHLSQTHPSAVLLPILSAPVGATGSGK